MGRVFRRNGSATTAPAKSTEQIERTPVDVLPEINRLSASTSFKGRADILSPQEQHPQMSMSAPLPSSSSFLPILNISNSLVPLKTRGSFRSNISLNPLSTSAVNNVTTNSSVKNNLNKISMEVGLENLGNSCFMNSSLQCLLHIEPLVSYFLTGNHINDINTNSPLQGKLASSFGQLVKDMFEARDGSIVSPVQFFKQLRVLAPHLVDYQQQDSQEFLRFVLDGLCEDLCRSKSNTDVVAIRRKSSSFHKDQIASSSDRDSFKGSLLRAPDLRDSSNRTSFRRNGSTFSISPQTVSKWTPESIEEREHAVSSKSCAVSSTEQPMASSPVAVSGLFSDMSLASSLRPEVDTEDSAMMEASSITSANPTTNIKAEAKKSWDAYMRFNDSVVADLFAGQLQSTVTCLTCKQKSFSFDPFLDLAIPIPSSRNPESKMTMTGRLRGRLSVEIVRCSLEECLQNFTTEEVLEGDNMINCDHCKEKRAASKRLALYKLPKILVLQIKRFRTGKFSREKLNTDVVFPLSNLDLTPFVSSDISSGPTSYDLVGISHHSGTMHGGHYVATIDINSNKDGIQKWVNFNDGIVTHVGPTTLSGPSAYVLFYKLK